MYLHNITGVLCLVSDIQILYYTVGRYVRYIHYTITSLLPIDVHILYYDVRKLSSFMLNGVIISFLTAVFKHLLSYKNDI